MDHDLRIRSRVEAMAAGAQALSELRKVVDLAVEHDPGRLVLVVNRLVAAGHVDDAEPPHAEADATLQPDALVIRTPMGDRLAHPVQQSVVRWRPASCGQAADSAHGCSGTGVGGR